MLHLLAPETLAAAPRHDRGIGQRIRHSREALEVNGGSPARRAARGDPARAPQAE